MEIFIFIVIVHWISDFILQDEKWALGKSKHNIPLIKHTSLYSIMWLIPVWFMTNDIIGSIYFILITFLFHTITDYFTSRLVKKKYEKGYISGSIPNLGMMSTIGFDQVLHYVQLGITWKLLFGY